MNREAWLNKAKELLERKYFSKPSKALPPKLAISCGIPKGSSKAIGQCWDPTVTKDGTTQIFICPSQDDPIEILQILLHELIHACVGLSCGHKGDFARMARAVGLQGKLTATVVHKGTPLHNELDAMARKIGPYPHKAMTKQKRVVKRVKRVTLVSPQDPEYRVTICQSVLQEHGPPTDPWGNDLVNKKK